MDIKEKIGLRIRNLREEQGISQKDFSYESDLDRSYLVSVENGKRNISIVNIEKVAKALNFNIKDFFNSEIFLDV